MGSEMCIRDRVGTPLLKGQARDANFCIPRTRPIRRRDLTHLPVGIGEPEQLQKNCSSHRMTKSENIEFRFRRPRGTIFIPISKLAQYESNCLIGSEIRQVFARYRRRAVRKPRPNKPTHQLPQGLQQQQKLGVGSKRHISAEISQPVPKKIRPLIG